MTDHRTEATMGLVCMLAHAFWHFIDLLTSHIDYYQMVSDVVSGIVTSLICGFFGAFGAWMWNKVKKRFEDETKDKR